MRHFHRTSVSPSTVLSIADAFFPTIGLAASRREERGRVFSGPLGTVTLDVRPEGGHYVFIEAHTDQVGESRLDRNVKRYFVKVHRAAEPSHRLTAAY
jgi:hypothetical protein